MGTFTVKIDVGDPEGRRWETMDALVDTGASHTVVPGSILRGLGILPEERWPFELADGRTIECDVAETRVRIDGRHRHTVIVFGEERSKPLLGAATLEAFRLAPDPVGRRLIPVPGLLKVHGLKTEA